MRREKFVLIFVFFFFKKITSGFVCETDQEYERAALICEQVGTMNRQLAKSAAKTKKGKKGKKEEDSEEDEDYTYPSEDEVESVETKPKGKAAKINGNENKAAKIIANENKRSTKKKAVVKRK